MTALISRFGALGVFVLMIPESACIPVPSELTLLFSGFAVSQHWMSFLLAVVAATAGNLAGSLLAYGIGATCLPASVPGARIVLERTERLLDEHGLRAVFIARLLPLGRTFVSLPAGARHLPLVPFVGLTALGCAIWAVVFIVIGLVSGTTWQAVDSVLGKGLLAAGIVTVLAVVIRAFRAPGQDDH